MKLVGVLVLVALCGALAIQMVIPSVVHAATSYTWTGNAFDGQWTTAGNWNPNGVPGPGDSATIGIAESVNLQTSTSVQNLTISGQGAGLNNGSLTITGSFNWTNYGAITTNIDIPSGATANISNPSPYRQAFQGSSFSVEGSATISSNQLVLGQTVLTNTGTVTLEPGSAIYAFACCVNPAKFINKGNVVVPSSSPGSPSALVNAVSFNDSSTATIGSNSILDLQIAPSTFANGVTFNGAGTLLIDYNGNVQLSGTVNLGSGTTFQVGSPGSTGTGFLNGTGTLTGTGSNFSWLNGTLNGTFTVASSVHSSISGSDQKLLQSPGGGGTTTLTLAGTTTLSGTQLVLSGGGAILNNTGTFTPQAGSTITAQSCCSSPAQFNNTGKLVVNVGAGNTFSISLVAFNNSGTVTLSSGTMRFGDPGYTQTGGSTMLNGGALASTTSAILNLNGGKLTGRGTITASVQNGALIDPGTTTPGEGLLTIAGNYTQTSAGMLRVDIKGTTPGVTYDQLSVSGTASLNGTLDIMTARGFKPTPSDQFIVVTAQTRTGTFATLLHYKISLHLQYYAQYTPTTAILKVKKV